MKRSKYRIQGEPPASVDDGQHGYLLEKLKETRTSCFTLFGVAGIKAIGVIFIEPLKHYMGLLLSLIILQAICGLIGGLSFEFKRISRSPPSEDTALKVDHTPSPERYKTVLLSCHPTQLT